jgi:hypothetical protein
MILGWKYESKPTNYHSILRKTLIKYQVVVAIPIYSELFALKIINMTNINVYNNIYFIFH